MHLKISACKAAKSNTKFNVEEIPYCLNSTSTSIVTAKMNNQIKLRRVDLNSADLFHNLLLCSLLAFNHIKFTRTKSCLYIVIIIENLFISVSNNQCNFKKLSKIISLFFLCCVLCTIVCLFDFFFFSHGVVISFSIYDVECPSGIFRLS